MTGVPEKLRRRHPPSQKKATIIATRTNSSCMGPHCRTGLTQRYTAVMSSCTASADMCEGVETVSVWCGKYLVVCVCDCVLPSARYVTEGQTSRFADGNDLNVLSINFVIGLADKTCRINLSSMEPVSNRWVIQPSDVNTMASREEMARVVISGSLRMASCLQRRVSPRPIVGDRTSSKNSWRVAGAFSYEGRSRCLERLAQLGRERRYVATVS
mmetsp:Transcript_41849/g.90775  ORF Transcript_41849/g.90775 Transcript_41849/m.90775 type:complete len:214 (-) Transcript_41849:847-1488(-)